MNLMFWKKKAGTGGDAETPQDDSAGKAAGRKSPATESADPESPDSEAPAKPGLIAKISSQFAALIRRFKKPPAFSAEGGQTANATGQSKSAPEDATPTSPPNLKKRLIIAGTIGLIILLLAGIGFAVRKVFLSTPTEDKDTPVTIETPRAAKPAPQASASRAEIEALKKKNEELQAQIEALKKEQPRQQATGSTAPQSNDNIRSSSDSGEVMIDNKDPKTTAMSLKEAIDAMNESSGGYDKKSAK
ncbi:MAG: hypothetical protein Q7S46_05990 [Gallionella sp.]|nr:hypothetical protein [Gallionella sp.]